ncbi:MAG TPA: methyltransferase domain-containing protein, partial [Gemmataceae bacterium]|nr:methyltransferase domain-containing protein [Gemmataceae bacterium]
LRHLPGYYNVDHLPLPGVDILADLEEPLADLPDNCVGAIYCRHTLEHVAGLLPLLGELHRVTRAGGRIEVIVPHFSNPYGYSDPTHVRFFGLYSFFYLADEGDQPRRKVPNFYLAQRFRVEQVSFNLLRTSVMDKVVRAVLQPLVNRGVGWLDWYERRLCRLLPADDIHWLLRPVKTAASHKAAA